MHYEEAMENCIFQFIAGSHQYGTNRPDSDIDTRGVFIAPLHYAFDIFKSAYEANSSIRQTLYDALDCLNQENYAKASSLIHNVLLEDRGDLSIGIETVHLPGEDTEIQELRKFFKLAAGCNPNIIEFLYVGHLIKKETPEWEKIRNHRHFFLSKRARYTFTKYAIAQLNRIQTHRGYLLHPPKAKPTREEFGLSKNHKLPKEHQNAILSLPDQWIVNDAKEVVLRERQYASALQNWNAYNKWSTERNPARKELEMKYGYDLKHAMHLVRLIRMGKEILRDGVVIVRRPDAEELKGILRGEWKYEEIEKIANTAESEMEELDKVSTLRESPDKKRIANLYKEICEERYKIKLD